MVRFRKVVVHKLFSIPVFKMKSDDIKKCGSVQYWILFCYINEIAHTSDFRHFRILTSNATFCCFLFQEQRHTLHERALRDNSAVSDGGLCDCNGGQDLDARMPVARFLPRRVYGVSRWRRPSETYSYGPRSQLWFWETASVINIFSSRNFSFPIIVSNPQTVNWKQLYVKRVHLSKNDK